DRTIRLWNVSTGQQLRQFDAETTGAIPLVFAFLPDGRTVASGGWGSRVRLWEVATGRQELQFNGHQAAITSLAFVPHSAEFATGSNDGTIRIWDSGSGLEVRKFEANHGDAETVALSPDGKVLASCGISTTPIRLRDSKTGQEVRRLLSERTA